MQLVWQKATNCVYTTFFFAAMSLSWFPSGVTITYTHSTGASVVANVQAVSECGLFVAIKFEINGQVIHHLHIKLNFRCTIHCQELPANLRTSPRMTSKQLDITRNYQHTSKHHQQILANKHDEVPQSIQKAP